MTPSQPPGQWQPQQQPYGQPQGPWQQYPPQYAQTPVPPGPPRKRHTLRTVLLSVTGLIVAIIAISALAASGSHTITTGQTSSAPASSAPASPAAKAKPAGTGSAITLSGLSSGEQMTVTVVKVFSHAQPASSFDAPGPGKRLYAVQFRLADTGSAAYSDAPDNGAEVTDAAGQSYQSSYSNVIECQSFPGTENIAAGASGLGCVVFEVPEHAVIAQVQFTLDSGMGPQTGQWEVRR